MFKECKNILNKYCYASNKSQFFFILCKDIFTRRRKINNQIKIYSIIIIIIYLLVQVSFKRLKIRQKNCNTFLPPDISTEL